MTENSDQVPVLRCIVSAFIFLRRNLTWVYWLGGLYIITNISSFWLTAYHPDSPTLGGLGTVMSIALIPLVVVLYAAYLRRALGLTSAGRLGLQLGADELRLFLTMFAVGAVTAFIIFLGAIAGVFALSAVITSVVDPAILEAEPTSAFSQAGVIGIITTVIVGLAIGMLGLYTIARFSPAYPAVIAEGRVVVFEAAAWSKGQGWRMVLAVFLTSLPFYLLIAPGLIQYAQYVFANMPVSGSTQVSLPDDFSLKPFLWFFVLKAVLWPASMGAISGLYVTFYRGLRASRGSSS